MIGPDLPPPAPEGCPPPEIIEEAAAGRIDDAAILVHIATCPRCAALADGARADNLLLSELAHAAVASGRPSAGDHGDASAPPGFDILGELHRGGQGVVHDAIQRSTRRRVALKRLLRGPFATRDERRRFEREIEIVARLRHPGIVTLFESGVDRDGGAWFAMEYVDGLPLDQYLAAVRPPRRTRVAVMQAIAEAVSCAHLQGVIHRDLKPGNIVVTAEGEPRVLDFGLARPVDIGRAAAVTADGRFVGTLAYAAPEQLAGAGGVDVRTDVYALGLILFEALVGRRPLDGEVSLETFLRARREAVPQQALAEAGVDGDLRAIVARATAPEPARRYQSASALADDLRRWLDGRPVAARADSTAYLLLRTARRHWLAVGALAAILLTVAGSAVLTSILYVRAERERALAERTLAAFTDALLAADPLAPSAAGTTMSDFLDAAGRRIEQSLAEDPEVAVRVRATLGGIALNLADLERAQREFAYVLETRRALDGPRSVAAAAATHDLARVKYRRGEFEEAASLYEQALRIRRALLGPVDPDVATTTSHLAACRRRVGRTGEAEDLYREALAIREALAEEMPEALAESLNNLAIFLLDAGAVDEAAGLLERSLEMIRGVAGPADWRTARAMSNLAAARLEQGRVEGTRALLESAREVWTARVAPDHPFQATVLMLLGRSAMLEGDHEEAERLTRRALEIRRQRVSAGHPDALETAMWHAVALREVGRPEESEALLRDVVARRAPGAATGPLGRAEIELAMAVDALGRTDEAKAILSEAIGRLDVEQGNPHLARAAREAMDAMGREAGE